MLCASIFKEKRPVSIFFTKRNLCQTHSGGTIEDTRDRKVYVIPPKYIKNIDCKIAPLKDLIKNPVKNNGSLGCRVSKENDKQSDF